MGPVSDVNDSLRITVTLQESLSPFIWDLLKLIKFHWRFPTRFLTNSNPFLPLCLPDNWRSKL